MSNRYRGEVKLRLAEQNFVMRPTFQALCSIEGDLDKSLIILISELQNKGILLSEQIIIIKHGLTAAGNDMSHSDIEVMLSNSNIAEVFNQICLFLKYGLGVQADGS